MKRPRATFPRSARLRGEAQFTGHFKNRYSSKHFLLLIRPGGTNDGSARLGIVIGRRQVSRAVERSFLRRMIREAFRTCRTALGQSDALVRCRVNPMAVNRTVVHRELDELFGRVGK